MSQLSLTYIILRKLGFNYSEEEYGQVSVIKVITQFFSNIYHSLLLSMMDWVIFEPINPRMFRSFLLRRLGCKVGKGVFIGDNVIIDLNHADLIIIEDNVHITGGCRLLCHQRDISKYYKGDDYTKLPYIRKPIHLKKGCSIGMQSFILPGVTIGEGAIVGAGSLVSKDIPEWTIAVGRPARVVKNIKEKSSDY
ncbi:MAG: acyltransferase [Eubacteriales bacterium]|nr:acyltransferase [Eubacteriales bacterium]